MTENNLSTDMYAFPLAPLHGLYYSHDSKNKVLMQNEVIL
jgi:hypothetical protein